MVWNFYFKILSSPQPYCSFNWVYARGDIHNNTAESFSAILERAKQGVFHYLSKKHLSRYLHEIGFRWDHRIPELKLTKKGDLKLVMKPMSVIIKLKSLLSRASGRQLRRSLNGGILCLEPVWLKSSLFMGYNSEKYPLSNKLS